MRDEVLEKLFATRGVNAKVARACGISTSAVAQWRRVPESRVEVVARETGVSASELRPDLFGAEAA